MKGTIIAVVVTLLLIAGIVFSYRSPEATATYWKNTRIACLPNGHTNLGTHIHAKLAITVQTGESTTTETVPANIGVSSACLAEVHTHETDNIIHIETPDADATRTLGDFYQVWGKEIARPGFDLEISVDGEKRDGPLPEDLILKDGETIELEYTKSKSS